MRVEVSGLRRSGPGSIALLATAHYTRRDADRVEQVNVPRFSSIAVTLVDHAKQATPVPLTKRRMASGMTVAEGLPFAPDGDDDFGEGR